MSRGYTRAMRVLVPAAILVAAAAVAPGPPLAQARPEFARREAKACGYCHINPRGGGSRNERGLEYARNEFAFPVREGNLNVFAKDRDREAMVRARKLIDLDHTPEAVKALTRLGRAVKRDEAAARLVADELHALDVKGTEILGQARLMLRSNDEEKRAEGVELLVLLTLQYKGLDVHGQASDDLKELRREKDLRDLVASEQREAKARLDLLDAYVEQADGDAEGARRAFEKIAKAHEGTRAAKEAAKEIARLDAASEGG